MTPSVAPLRIPCVLLVRHDDPSKYHCQAHTPLPVLYVNEGRARAAMRSMKAPELRGAYVPRPVLIVPDPGG